MPTYYCSLYMMDAKGRLNLDVVEEREIVADDPTAAKDILVRRYWTADMELSHSPFCEILELKEDGTKELHDVE